jgi:hypothetical protein
MRKFRFKQMNLIEEESVSSQLNNLKKKKPTEKNSYQEGEDWDPINWLNPATFVCLSLARTSISNIICHILLFCVQSKIKNHYSGVIAGLECRRSCGLAQ